MRRHKHNKFLCNKRFPRKGDSERPEYFVVRLLGKRERERLERSFIEFQWHYTKSTDLDIFYNTGFPEFEIEEVEESTKVERLIEKLKLAIEKLSMQDREILKLHMAGMIQAEIARKLGVTQGYVSQRLTCGSKSTKSILYTLKKQLEE